MKRIVEDWSTLASTAVLEYFSPWHASCTEAGPVPRENGVATGLDVDIGASGKQGTEFSWDSLCTFGTTAGFLLHRVGAWGKQGPWGPHSLSPEHRWQD